MGKSLSETDVVVLAGGLGSRIRPVLGDVPKLLAPIGTRTYLDYLFDWLTGFGAGRVILSLGHLSGSIVDYVAAHPRPGLTVETVIEETPMGTAGALRLVRPHIRAKTALVMNGDSWIGADLNAFVGAHESGGVPATLLCVQVPDAGRYGSIDIDQTGRIRAFREKQPDAGAGRINAGVYAFSAAAWRMIDAASGPSLERDVFALQPPGTLAAYDAGQVPFIDIGTPESLACAAAVIAGDRAGM